jgi:hypothetical protein
MATLGPFLQAGQTLDSLPGALMLVATIFVAGSPLSTLAESFNGSVAKDAA